VIAQEALVPESENHDIGVLFVHGIGDQRRGATLREFGLPLIESVGDWLGHARVTSVQAAEADQDVPDHAEVTIQSDGRTLRVLTAESWWAATFCVPGYLVLMRWLLSVVPFLVQRAVDGGVRRSTVRMRGRLEQASASRLAPRLGHWLAFLVHSSWRLLQNAAALAFTIGVMAVLIVVGALSWIPRMRARILGPAGSAGSPRVRSMLRLILGDVPAWLPTILVCYIGDSYALLRDSTAAAAMRGRVERDLRWLEEQNPGAPVAIVAHSQGAELARQVVIRRHRGNPVDSLITFGAGIEKLRAVDLLQKRLGLAWAAFGLRILSAGGLMLVLAAALGSVAPWAAPIGLCIAFTALWAARAVLLRVMGACDDGDRLGTVEGRVGHWLDLYASHDPVSEGSLPVSSFGTSIEIVNRRSPLLDHTSYWQNVEAFRSAVALELARVAGWRRTTQLPDAVVAGATDRDKRVRRLVGTHKAIAVVAGGLAAFSARDVGESLAGAVGAVDGSVGTILSVGWRPYAAAYLLLAVTAGGLVLLSSRAWDEWSGRRTRELLAEHAARRRDQLAARPAVVHAEAG
jgi:hypothetical protein